MHVPNIVSYYERNIIKQQRQLLLKKIEIKWTSGNPTNIMQGMCRTIEFVGL
ncbi:unnamed protein product [Acanthoscelides obtectus]|uniref:Uncharacterized protein n=1 Tax=Acanthoscelides obtectus TaxID=200917 RepID=A0A9P0JTW8_ACAOB|nr:unnamed protein product [Acanthoscelides obtectus]CAK1679289.1 hypothetical protein AOBTE_LOCUS32201 [Acanthoscelides obtectus]